MVKKSSVAKVIIMFSSRFAKLASQNRTAWKAGVAVVIAGTTFKVRHIHVLQTIYQEHITLYDSFSFPPLIFFTSPYILTTKYATYN